MLPDRPVNRWHPLLLSGGALLLVLVLVIAVVVVIVFAEDHPQEVVLDLGGDANIIETDASTVGDLLQEQGILLDAGDIVIPEPETRLQRDMIVEVHRARTVALTVDGVTSILRTTLDNPLDILNYAGLEVSVTDRVEIDGTRSSLADLVAWPVPVSTIEIVRTVPVRIVDGETTIEHHSIGETVGEALAEAGVDLYLADSVTPDLGVSLTPDMEIVVDRSRTLTVVVDGSRMETRTRGQTVADALQENGIVLSGLDYTIPAESARVVSGMSVRVLRVTEEVIAEQEEIPFETIYQADAERPLDNRAITQEGQPGIIQRMIRMRYENGIEISRELEEETLVQEARNRIVTYGTQVVIRTLDTPDGTIEYWRHMRMYATSYYPAELGSSTTSIGFTLRKGIVAIDPNIIRYRTNVYVPGYGQGIAADTGGPRSSPYWIDLGYSDEDWVPWSRLVDVYLLTPVPDQIDYLLPTSYRGGVIAP